MAPLLKGDVVWADLDPVVGREQAGLRPVLILSEEIFNLRSQTVIAMAITSQAQRAGYPLTYPLQEKFFPKPSWVKIGQVRTLSVARLRQKLGRVSPETLDRILRGLQEILGSPAD
jgi:mRNA interferase MazF